MGIFVTERAAAKQEFIEPGEVTRLLTGLRSSGDDEIYDRLMPMIHSELHRLASGFLERERIDHTLQPTALVNEAFMRLADQRSATWESRGHFLAIAAVAMRRILVDHARAHRSAKRGGSRKRRPLDSDVAVVEASNVDLIALDDALDALMSIDPRKARIVELRFFAGLTVEETALAMGLSTPTIKREWKMARLWLRSEIVGNE